MAHMKLADTNVVAHLLAPDGAIPNHPRWPLLVYPASVALSGDDPAAIFEDLFARNRWPAAWRNGVHSVSAVAAVPLPACDPVFGPKGPLFDHWTDL